MDPAAQGPQGSPKISCGRTLELVFRLRCAPPPEHGSCPLDQGSPISIPVLLGTKIRVRGHLHGTSKTKLTSESAAGEGSIFYSVVWGGSTQRLHWRRSKQTASAAAGRINLFVRPAVRSGDGDKRPGAVLPIRSVRNGDVQCEVWLLRQSAQQFAKPHPAHSDTGSSSSSPGHRPQAPRSRPQTHDQAQACTCRPATQAPAPADLTKPAQPSPPSLPSCPLTPCTTPQSTQPHHTPLDPSPNLPSHAIPPQFPPLPLPLPLHPTDPL